MKTSLTFFSLLFFLGVGLFSSYEALAITDVAECGEDGSWDLVAGVCIPISTGLPDPDPENPVWTVLDTFLKWLLLVFGVIALIAFAVSGIMYLTSGGNENQIETAKRYMIWSVVGVIVALLGYIIILAVDTWLRGTTAIF